MPAIPALSYVEAHLKDSQLIAFITLLAHLLMAHFERRNPIFFHAANKEAGIGHDLCNAVCAVHAAASRLIRECNPTF